MENQCHAVVSVIENDRRGLHRPRGKKLGKGLAIGNLPLVKDADPSDPERGGKPEGMDSRGFEGGESPRGGQHRSGKGSPIEVVVEPEHPLTRDGFPLERPDLSRETAGQSGKLRLMSQGKLRENEDRHKGDQKKNHHDLKKGETRAFDRRFPHLLPDPVFSKAISTMTPSRLITKDRTKKGTKKGEPLSGSSFGIGYHKSMYNDF